MWWGREEGEGSGGGLRGLGRCGVVSGGYIKSAGESGGQWNGRIHGEQWVALAGWVGSGGGSGRRARWGLGG